MLSAIKVDKKDELIIMNAFINKIKNKIKNDDDYRGIFVGMTGKGKSGSAISLASMLDENFSADQIFFNPNEFLRTMKKLARQKRYGDVKGKCFVVDEAGVFINSREYRSKINQAINFLSQTQRFLNCYVLFTLPSLKQLDSQIRIMFHNIYEIVNRVPHPIKPYSFSISKIYNVKLNPVSIKTRFQSEYEMELRPLYVYINKMKYRVKHIYFHPPPYLIYEEYKIKKEIEMEKLYEKLSELVGEEVSPDNEDVAIRQIVEIVLNDIELFKTKQGNVSIDRIAKKFGINKDFARMIRKMVLDELKNKEELI